MQRRGVCPGDKQGVHSQPLPATNSAGVSARVKSRVFTYSHYPPRTAPGCLPGAAHLRIIRPNRETRLCALPSIEGTKTVHSPARQATLSATLLRAPLMKTVHSPARQACWRQGARRICAFMERRGGNKSRGPRHGLAKAGTGARAEGLTDPRLGRVKQASLSACVCECVRACARACAGAWSAVLCGRLLSMSGWAGPKPSGPSRSESPTQRSSMP